MESTIMLYKGARGKAQVIFDTDTFWLSQQRMADLFGVTQQDISYHLQQINDSGEIHLSDGYKKYLYGSEKWSDEVMYNLDVVIAVGYRVNSYEAILFRRYVRLPAQALQQVNAIGSAVISLSRGHSDRPSPLAQNLTEQRKRVLL